MEQSLNVEKERLDLIKSEYNRILEITNRAVNAETNNQLQLADQLYNEALDRMQIILGLNIAAGFSRNSEIFKQVSNYQTKLRHLEVNMNEGRLRCKASAAFSNSSPEKTQVDREARVLFVLSDGVQYCRIDPTGQSDVPSYPSSMYIYQILSNASPSPRTSAQTEYSEYFLTIGEWAMPLVPGVTPLLLSNQGLLVFGVNSPDTHSIGVALPVEMSIEQQTEMLRVLSQVTIMRMESTPLSDASAGQSPPEYEGETTSKPTSGQNVASGMQKVTEIAVKGMVAGAGLVGRLVSHGGEALKSRLAPAPNPDEAVDPRYVQGAYYARVGTGQVVKISGKFIYYIEKGAMKAGEYLSPHIRKTTKAYLPTSWTSSSTDGKPAPFDEACVVIAAGVDCISNIFDGLLHSGRIVGSNLAQSTGEVVGHKYGKDYGNITQNSMHAVGNVGLTAMNVKHFGPKGLLKLAGKSAAIGVVSRPSETAPSRASNSQQ